MKRKLISLLLLCSVIFNLSSCFMTISAENLMDGVTPNQVKSLDSLDSQNVAVTDFALRLMTATEESGENTLLSPLSVIAALAMTANGAKGTTLSEMESVLGLSRDELNLYLYTYLNSLPQGDKYKLSVANSIWFTDDDKFTVNNAFLQKNADYYGAEIYKTKFNDQTKRDINNWVRKETDGMIPKILERVPEDAIMYLINALAFEAEWTSIYEHDQVRDGTFTKEDGTKQSAKLMYCDEYGYLEDENAQGFIKYYKGRKYAFAALLPNEGTTITEYLSTLSGEKLNAMLSKPQGTTVKTAIPKFKTEYSVEMSEILADMGMPTAFNVTFADFSDLGNYEDNNIYISNVLHKTYIEVAERGTKAGAVTVIEMAKGTGMPEEPKRVYLDRPFIYMIIDCENNIPIFLGTLMDLNN